MANPGTELTRPGYRRRWRHWIALACLSLLAIGCAKPSAKDRSAAALESIPAGAGTTPKKRNFEGRIGRFDTAGDRLVVVAGKELILTTLADGMRSVTKLDQTVTDLVYAEDGSLWLIGQDDVSYWRHDEMQCLASDVGASPSLLTIADDRIDLTTEFYIDGSGVFGERISVGTDCSVKRGLKKQAIETATTPLNDGQRLVARAATIDAGPSWRLGPTIEHRRADELLATIPVFESRSDIAKISAIAAGVDRVIALGTGTDASHWELWTIDAPRLVATGTLAAPSDRLLPLATSGHVIVGRELIDLTSGQGQPLIDSGAIQDVTDDQAWWLVAEGGRLSLRSAKQLNGY